MLTLSRESAQARPASIATTASVEAMRIAELAPKNASSARMQMLALYRRNGLHSGTDFLLAAQTLEGSKDRQDMLMAHDMALASMALGIGEAKSIVARTEDRLLDSLGLGQRYGTLKGGKLPLTAKHRQLMTMSSKPAPLQVLPVPSVD
ncbi:hypothetical protein EON82_13440 [bacterium]|nr:MAG: hypothetical protein EON82_13440 [bacterium]